MITSLGLFGIISGIYIIIKGTKQQSVSREGWILLLGSIIIIVSIVVMFVNISARV